MQKINSLEQWQDKAKQYNPKANNGWVWAMIIAILLMVFAMPYIYPGPMCWDNIDCAIYTHATPSEPGTEVCTIRNLTVEEVPTEVILIEVIQGGANSDRDYSFIANRDSIAKVQKIDFEMSEETTPTYILCHVYDPGTAATGGYEAGKMGLINFWMSTSTSTERDYEKAIIVMPDINFYMPEGIDLAVADTNIIKSYTNLPATTDNPFILGLAWLLFAFGIFLSFTFVFQLFKRR
jgi:hypothetical protein